MPAASPPGPAPTIAILGLSAVFEEGSGAIMEVVSSGGDSGCEIGLSGPKAAEMVESGGRLPANIDRVEKALELLDAFRVDHQ